ncbi:MAG: hypothetical protein ABT940_07225, partial [Alphaproteobacteria bacterium]
MAERKRGQEIRGLSGRLGLPDAMVDDHITRGTSLDEFRAVALEHVAARSAGTTISGHHGSVQMGASGDDPAVKVRAMAEAISVRFLPSSMVSGNAPSEHARSYTGYSVLDMGAELLEARGERVGRGDRNRLVMRALGTSDFPILLASASDKILLSAYQLVPTTYRRIAAQRDLNDFKTKNLVRVGEFPDLLPVAENGEYKAGALSEGKETARLTSVGRRLMLTRQALINDDLGALADFARGAAGSAARYENATVWAVLTGNAKLGDGKGLFHADHYNLAANADVGAISVTTVGYGREAVRIQKTPDGNHLNQGPVLLVVPASLETRAEQFVSPFAYPATPDAVVPERLRSLNLVVESLLDADSRTGWYLACDPNILPGIQYGWLSGNSGPQTYQEVKPGVGIEFQVWEDFYAAPLDYRPWHKNPGA